MMIFRQLFDEKSYTYTYLVADEASRDAFIIDPVLEKLESYQLLLTELSLNLVYAIDTHVHADHITALGKLGQIYGCELVHGEHSQAKGVTKFVSDGEVLQIGTLQLRCIATPGHTNDSVCFYLAHSKKSMLFTGDTLLIRGTGRADFQQGCATSQYESITRKLLAFDDATLVYPGHDYRGLTVSTIAEERQFNPRLQVANANEYKELMQNLSLAEPKQMAVAVPANLVVGLVG